MFTLAGLLKLQAISNTGYGVVGRHKGQHKSSVKLNGGQSEQCSTSYEQAIFMNHVLYILKLKLLTLPWVLKIHI